MLGCWAGGVKAKFATPGSLGSMTYALRRAPLLGDLCIGAPTPTSSPRCFSHPIFFPSHSNFREDVISGPGDQAKGVELSPPVIAAHGGGGAARGGERGGGHTR